MSKSTMSVNKSEALKEGAFDSDHPGGVAQSHEYAHSESEVIPVQLGHDVIGPLCYGFVRWLVAQAHQQGLEHLYFLSRDGWLLKQAFDQLSPTIKGNLKSHYLYSSRRAVWFAALDEHTAEAEYNEILAGASPYVPVKGYLQRIFIDPSEFKAQIVGAGFSSENHVVQSDADRQKLHQLFRNIKPTIVKKARAEREDYLAYLRHEGLFEHSHVGLVDVGWTGSIVKYTRKLVAGVDPNLDLHAYFIGVGDKARSKYGFTKGECLHGYLFDFDDVSHAEIRKAFFVIEKFLSPNEPSLIKMSRAGGEFKPVYKAGPREVSPLNNLVQKSALQFVREQRSVTEPFDEQCFLPQLKKLLADPDPQVARLLSRYSYSSDFGYQVNPNPIAHSKAGADYLRKPLHLFRDYRRARWKAGFIAQQSWPARQLLRAVRRTGLDKRYDQLLARIKQ